MNNHSSGFRVAARHGAEHVGAVGGAWAVSNVVGEIA
jgi:hypothetical protein